MNAFYLSLYWFNLPVLDRIYGISSSSRTEMFHWTWRHDVHGSAAFMVRDVFSIQRYTGI